MNKPHTLLEEYQEFLDEDGFPLANSAKRIWDVAKLAGREIERNVVNTAGQVNRAATAYADAMNPFMSIEEMGQRTAEIDKNIETALTNIDARYKDAIEALYAAAGLTDSQVFMFMLSPALYLGMKTAPNAVLAASQVLSNAANKNTNNIVNNLQRFANYTNKFTTMRGPGANQAASYSGGGYGAYDFGGDYGSEF